MYVLILTTFMTVVSSMSGYGSVNTEIHHVEGFTSEKSCKVAGKAWLTYARSDNLRKSAVCVKL